MFKSLLSFVAILASSLLLPAQRPNEGGGRNGFNNPDFNNGRFYGKLLDETTGKKVEYASVQLLGMRWDSVAQKRKEVILAGQLTGENGEFSLEKLPVMGDFTLKINCIGYEPFAETVTFGFKRGQGRPDMSKIDRDLGNIKLKPANVMLKETEIVGQAAGFSLALDKKVFKMDKNLNAAGGTAEDALKNVPSLSVDIDGNLTLRNAAPQLFVDGRPTNLTLDQIPADAIDNVELITNPSAKYDASGGSAGIVNIVLKKERRIGYNGSVRAGIDMRGKPNLGADINAREGKINAFLSGNLNGRRSKGTNSTDRNNLFGMPRTNVFQDGANDNTRYNFSGRTGLDWFINNRNTLTFAANYTFGNNRSTDFLHIQTDTLNGDGSTIANSLLSDRNSKGTRQYSNPGGQILYKKLFPMEGRELTADINFNGSDSENENKYNTAYLFNVKPENAQRQLGNGNNQNYTIQSDFTTPVGKGMKLETGLRAAIRSVSSSNQTYQRNGVNATEVRVYNFADEYQYLDQVYAAYGNFSKSYPKWGFQTGLRVESSTYHGDLPVSGSTFGNQYPLSLFPSVFTTYKLNEEDNLQLNYSRRVNRPSFFQLIPFSDFSDSLLLSRGNPNLLPEFTNSLELSWQNIINRNHNFLASIYFRQAYNLITRYQFSEYNDFLGREAIVSSYQNANSGYAYGLEFTIKNTVAKVIDFTTNANFFNSVVNAQNIEASLKTEQFSWNVKENIGVKLPSDWSLQFNGEYSSRTALANFSGGGRGGHGGGGWRDSPTSTAQGYRTPLWSVDFSVKKSFYKRKMALTLSISDIFRSNINGSHAATTSFIQDSERLRDPQFIRLNYSYRFGKFDTSLFRRKNTRDSGDGMDF